MTQDTLSLIRLYLTHFPTPFDIRFAGDNLPLNRGDLTGGLFNRLAGTENNNPDKR
jgi:hypothetical protein